MGYIVEGHIVDIEGREIFDGSVEVEGGVIRSIRRHPIEESRGYIMPGFIDAHAHIESSMLTPINFGRIVMHQGTVAVVSDPHEIANVMGCEGVEFMVAEGRRSPIKIRYTIPSCVPATPFDRSGGVISSQDVEQMAASGEFVALSEMMNVPGVLYGDEEVMAKIATANRYNLPIDGHAPLLRGDDLERYVGSGITTDHECVSLEEAQEKISLGMKILIREGSAALDYEALKSLIATNPADVMFCSDDLHPREIEEGHLRRLIRRSLASGFDLFDVLRIVSINPIGHYCLDVGALKVGDSADFIVVESLETFLPREVYIDGVEQLQRQEEVVAQGVEINNFNHEPIDESALRCGVDGTITIMSLVNGELLTEAEEYRPREAMENMESDVEQDVIKIVYINRYENGQPQVAFCKGFGLKRGAVASTVAHDSHNIIAVGCSDRDIAAAVNAIIECRGGLATCCEGRVDLLPLPIGGIMSGSSAESVMVDYERLETMVKEMGSPLDSPFMTLSFLSLVVIPEVKIGERGLFSYSKFDWIDPK